MDNTAELIEKLVAWGDEKDGRAVTFKRRASDSFAAICREGNETFQGVGKTRRAAVEDALAQIAKQAPAAPAGKP